MAEEKAALRFAIGGWIFVYTPNTKKIEICRSGRPELAHLTIDFETRSGTLDVHLTFQHESSGGDSRKKTYTRIAQIPMSVLEAATREKLREFERVYREGVLVRYRRFRPGGCVGMDTWF